MIVAVQCDADDEGQVFLLTAENAEALTQNIVIAVEEVHELILRALAGRADKALGYASWQDYVDDRFPLTVRQVARDTRPENVAFLRERGQSLRAIASVLGVSKSQVERDLSTVPDGTVEPDRVVGIDGKSRPTKKPTTAKASPKVPQSSGLAADDPAGFVRDFTLGAIEEANRTFENDRVVKALACLYQDALDDGDHDWCRRAREIVQRNWENGNLLGAAIWSTDHRAAIKRGEHPPTDAVVVTLPPSSIELRALADAFIDTNGFDAFEELYLTVRAAAHDPERS